MFDKFGQRNEPRARKVKAYDFWGEPLYEGDTAIYVEEAGHYIHVDDLDEYVREVSEAYRKALLKQIVYFSR